MNKFRENLLKYLSFIFVLIVPIIFWNQGLYPHISSKTFFLYGAVQTMFAVWLYALAVDKSYRLGSATWKRFIPLFAFVLWMTLAGIFAVNSELSFYSTLGRGTGLLTLYHLTAFALIISSLFKKHGWEYIISLLKWSLVGSCILAISVWLGTDGFKFTIPVLKKDAGGGFSGNSTITATYFLFTFAISAILLSSQKIGSGFKKFIYFTLATIIFSPVFLSLYGLFTGGGIMGTARGTMLGLITGLGATGVGYMFLSKNKTIRRSSIGIIIVGALTFSFLWVQLITPNTYLHNTFEEAARGSRFIFWEVAEKAMSEYPVLGYGSENYSIAYQKYFNPQILTESNSFEGWGDKAHNIYYDLGASGGYPAIFLYSILLLGVLYALYQKHNSGKLNRLHASVVFGVFIAYIANNLFTFENVIVLVNVFLLFGVVFTFEDEDDNKKVEANISELQQNILKAVLLGLFLSAFIFLTLRPVLKSKLYAETFSAPLNARPAMYEKLLQGSVVGSHWDASGMAFETYKKYVSSLAETKNDKTLLPYIISDLKAIIGYMGKVAETNKTDYRLYITRAYLGSTLTYYTNEPYTKDQMDAQLLTLAQARKLAPTNPNVYWSTAQVKVWGGDYKGAEDAYKEGIRVAPKLPSSYRLLLTFAEVLGDKKLFEETLAEALANIPNFSRD